MIGMTMPSIQVVRHHDVRPMTSNDFDELLPDDYRRRIGQMFVAVPEQIDVADAEDGGCVAQLRLAPGRQLLFSTQRWIAT